MAERYLVIETHPNKPTSGWGYEWVGKIGTREEVKEYIKKVVEEGNEDYLDCIVPLEEGAEVEEIDRWLPKEE